jgi:hypothetical protein
LRSQSKSSGVRFGFVALILLPTYSGLPSTMSTGHGYVNLTLNRYSRATTFIPLRRRLVEGVVRTQPMVYPNQLYTRTDSRQLRMPGPQ